MTTQVCSHKAPGTNNEVEFVEVFFCQIIFIISLKSSEGFDNWSLELKNVIRLRAI